MFGLTVNNIIGLNVIEEVIKCWSVPSDHIQLHWSWEPNCLRTICKFHQEELCFIKTTRHDTTVTPKQSLWVTCRVNTRPVARPTPVLFEPDETNPRPYGLEIRETLLTCKERNSSQVDIDITNQEIALRGRTMLGQLQCIQSALPVEVKIKEPDSGNNGTQQEVPGSGTTKPVHTLD